MRRIIQANIDRLSELLKTETDPTKRAMEARLLAEEEAKKKQLPEYDKNEKKAD
jgi:hypothetical protein